MSGKQTEKRKLIPKQALKSKEAAKPFSYQPRWPFSFIRGSSLVTDAHRKLLATCVGTGVWSHLAGQSFALLRCSFLGKLDIDFLRSQVKKNNSSSRCYLNT